MDENKTKLEPIENLIKKFNSLSKNEPKNKEKLIEIQEKISKQRNIVDRIDIDELRNRTNTDDYYKKQKYEKLLEEVEKYDDFEDELDDIEYMDLYSIDKPERNFKNRGLKIGITAGVAALIVTVGAITIHNIKENKRVDSYTQNGTTEFRTEEPTEAPTEIATEATTEAKTENTTEATTEQVFHDDVFSDEQIQTATDLFSKMNDGIDTVEKTFLDDDKREQAKSDAKDKIITYTDFIFYGTEIDGKTFDQLTDEEKEKVYTKYQELINTVNSYDPDYISNMSEKYQVVKDFGSLTLTNAKNKIKETVGEEYYNKTGETKDAVIDGTKDTFSLMKKFVQDKYENWRDNNKDE